MKVQYGEAWFCPRRLPKALLCILGRSEAGGSCCGNLSQKRAPRNKPTVCRTGSHRPNASLASHECWWRLTYKAVPSAQRYPCPLHGCPLLGPYSSAPGPLNHFRIRPLCYSPTLQGQQIRPLPSALTFFNPLLTRPFQPDWLLLIFSIDNTPFLLSHDRQGRAGEQGSASVQDTCFCSCSSYLHPSARYSLHAIGKSCHI